MKKVLTSVVTISLVFLSGCLGEAPAPEVTAIIRRPLVDDERKIIQTSILDQLKDPDSAKFRWPAIPKMSATTIRYCAYVNSKNSMGGYAGFQPVYAVLNTDASGNVEGVKELTFWDASTPGGGVAPVYCQMLGY